MAAAMAAWKMAPCVSWFCAGHHAMLSAPPKRRLTLPWTTECSPKRMTLAGAEIINAGIIGLDIFLDIAVACFAVPLALLPLVPLVPLSSAAILCEADLGSELLRCAWVAYKLAHTPQSREVMVR